MGLDIGQVMAKAGLEVVFRDMTDEILAKSMAKLEKGLDKQVAKGRMDEAQKADILSRVSTTTELTPAADADLVLEAIVEKKADFHKWGPFSDIEILDWEGFIPDMNDPEYVAQLKARMQDRVDEIKQFATAKEGYDKLPDDALAAIQKVVDELK